MAEEQQAVSGPLVSVVVPLKNGMPWLEQQLGALVAQEVSVAWEIVVADNGSDDGSQSLVRDWCTGHARMRLVDGSGVPGAGAARNAGVRAARGRLLAFCDADDVVRPGWLGALVASLEDADVVAGFFDFRALEGGPPMIPVPAATQQMGFLPFALGANLAVRREAFEAVHGFDETLTAGEDVDLCWRLQLAGYHLVVTPGAVVEKRERVRCGPMFRAAWSYGQCGPRLYAQYRARGMRPDLKGALKGWVWLVLATPGVVIPRRRRQWVRTLGIRLGSLASSLRCRVFFP